MIRPISNVLQNYLETASKPLAKVFFRIPISSNIFLSTIYTMACIQNLQDEDGAGPEQAYLSVTWGKQCALHQISVLALLISPRLLMSTSQFPNYLWLFLLPSSTWLWRRMKASALCTRRQLGVSVASAWYQGGGNFRFCFFLVVSDQAVLEFLLGLLRRDMVRQTLFDESPVFETEKEKEHFQGEK